MSWATEYIDKLQKGETVQFRPHGKSMTGYIESGQLVQVSPVWREIVVGDIVLCKVNRSQYLHFVKDIKNNQYQIGNAKGYINGWIAKDKIYGILNWVQNDCTQCEGHHFLGECPFQ
jgi:hypothetical protein